MGTQFPEITGRRGEPSAGNRRRSFVFLCLCGVCGRRARNYFLFANGGVGHIMLAMKNKAVKIGIVASILPHVFCCGMPIVLSIIGLVAPDAAHFHIIPHWMEPWIFVFSGAMLMLSWYLVARDCRCACDHCHGGGAHHVQKIILGIITVIFLISIILHMAAH